MEASKTHFEQIPVETVKKIAKELPENNAIGNDSPEERWREVAQQVQQELDPYRMIGLVQQLIDALDEKKFAKRRLRPRDARNRSGFSEIY